MIEIAQRTIQPLVMIEDRPSAIYIERCPKLLRDARKIDIFAVKLPVVVMERVQRAEVVNARERASKY